MTNVIPTPGQEGAAEFLRHCYGMSRIDWPYGDLNRHGEVRVVGIDSAGAERTRWIVLPDGSVHFGWDPDWALDGYKLSRKAVS